MQLLFPCFAGGQLFPGAGFGSGHEFLDRLAAGVSGYVLPSMVSSFELLTYTQTYILTYLLTYVHTYIDACMHACVHTYTHT